MNLTGQENYYSKTFTTENGLPHNHVYSIAQDKNEFLWIATWDGLSRYDGYEFRNYYHNPADTSSLGYFICEKVLVDCQNNVWVLGPGRLSKYNRPNDNFKQFKWNYIGGITTDAGGKLWVSTDDGIMYWDDETMVFKKIKLTNDRQLKNPIQNYPPNIAFDNLNHLWLIRNDNFNWYFFACTKKENSSYESEFKGNLDIPKYLPLLQNHLTRFEILRTASNEIYIQENLKSFKLDTLQKQLFPVFKIENITDSVIAGILLKKQQLYRLNSVPESINGIFVETSFNDNQNTLWRGIAANGSNQTGLTRTIQTPGGFKHYFTKMNPDAGFNAFSPVIKDRYGTVWAGATNTNAFFLHDKNGNETTLQPFDQTTWTRAQKPRAFLEDSAGILAGYFQKLLIYYSFQKKKFDTIIDKKTDYSDQSIPHSFIHLKKQGDNLIIVGFQEISTFNIPSKKFTVHKTFSPGYGTRLYCIAQDSDSSYWIGGGTSTLFHFNKDLTHAREFNLIKSLFNIEDIVLGDNNDLWLSLLGGGLARFDKTAGKIIKIYTTADGLPNNTLYGKLKDKNGNLWISTNQGLSRFNPETEQFRNFGPQDGLKINEFNSDNTFLATDGEMFFAGMGGVVSFYPDSLNDSGLSAAAYPLVITDFKVSGTPRNFKNAIYECDSIQLEKGENNFQLTFACLDFRNAEKIQYRYRLHGEKEVFTETNHRNRSVNYSNLSPGIYRFEVEATNRNGEWASKTALVIEILPYYYQTLLFRVLMVLVFILVTGYFIYSYNRQIRLKALQQQDELKLESLRGQMNPHFIFNSLNSINYFISQNDRLAANRYIADFARLIRSILGNLSHDYIPLSKELESINDYLQLEHLRFGDKFDYEVVLDDTISTDNFLVFPGMVQPFIENAIWHGVRSLEGRKGFVKISFYNQKPDSLFCRIEDDGVGRKLAETLKSSLPGKTSRGIGIVIERLKIVNHLRQTRYEVKIEDLFNDRKETGTCVIIEIPVKN